MIERLLIANRGEIAVRVARGAREMGIAPLGIYSEADSGAYHRQFMDESACVGPAGAADSYLNITAVIQAAKDLRADAVHPGYGFLSERPEFASAVRDAGLTFVGPSPAAMAAMGSKIEAKRRVRDFGVPVVPGYDGDDQSLERLRAEAGTIGTPLLIKASAGGGGRGMRVVEDLSQFEEALDAAKREAQAAFGSDAVLLERYLARPRHIEFQVLADAHGNVIHLGERECSIQRRHQKILEEAPSVAVAPALRAQMGAAAIRAAQSVGYVNAGTCEFMLDGDGKFYFLEMNARLQVEHPVTEMVYGIDLVHWQLRIASGETLTIAQADVRPRGWSIETRIYAEDPSNHMLPSTGTLATWSAPRGPGIRVDEGVGEGSVVSVYYDPMLAKLIVWAETRVAAIARLRCALDGFRIAGVRTNLPLLAWIARDTAFEKGETTTRFLEERLDESTFVAATPARDDLAIAIAARLERDAPPWRIGRVGVPLRLRSGAHEFAVTASATGNRGEWQLAGDLSGLLTVQTNGEASDVRLDGKIVRSGGNAPEFQPAEPPSLQIGAGASEAASGRIAAPMPGKIVKISVSAGDRVREHALLVVLEAMKMEHRIEAPGDGIVSAIHVREGDIVAAAAPLLELTAS